MVKITDKKIIVEQIIKKVSKKTNGAVVVFIGVVRRKSKGKIVKFIEYSAYKKMALKELKKIKEKIFERWKVKDVAIVHRVGKLKVGEICLVIAVGSEHRREAFESCRFAIEEIKRTVPIWKKEYYERI